MILTSGKFYSIDMNLACTFGMCEAFILCQVDGWLSNYQSTPSKRAYYEKDHFKEGRWWTYDTVDTLTENLKYYSKSTIKRSLANLKDIGVIIIGHFGGSLDRTNWYSIDYDHLYSMVESKFPDVNETNRRKAGNQNEIMHEINMSQCDRLNMNPSSSIYNIYNINKTNTSLRKAERMKDLPCPDENNTPYFFRQLKTADEDQECKAYMSNALDSILKVYQEVKMDDLEGGRRRIIELLRDLPSVYEIKRHVEGIRLGIDEYLNEYESNRNHTNRDTGQIDYTYLPKLSNLIESNFVNDQLGYYAKGLQIYDSAKEGEANAG